MYQAWQLAPHLIRFFPGDSPMTVEQNKAVARQRVEALLTQGNMDLVDTLVAADFVEHEQLPPGLPSGREGFRQATAMLHSAFSGFNAAVEDVIAEGGRVALRLTWSGTQTGEFMGIPPSGKRFSIAVFDILRIVDGKVVEHWGMMDTIGMMQQLGVIPAPGQGES
jgi:steroid delta-isomerase-like uncharacterized protein